MINFLFGFGLGGAAGFGLLFMLIETLHIRPCELDLPRSQHCTIIAIPMEANND